MSLTTSVEPLEGNKVRLHVAIPAEDFEQAIDAAFRKLAREVKMPGFRPGKAPRRLLEARIGSEVGRDQALRDSLPEYYAEAVVAEDVDVIAPPEIDITAGEDSGDVEFDAVVEVRPIVTVEGHDKLRIEIERPVVDDDDVERQVDMLRERFADLDDSEAPLTDGDYAEIDIKGFIDDESIEGLTATDYLYEVGSGIVVPKLDEELHGKRPGDILKFLDTLPERFGERAGQEVAFTVLVKEVKGKRLPAADDEFAKTASEFDSLDELKASLREQIAKNKERGADAAVRDRVLQALIDRTEVDLPDTLVDEETEHRVGHARERAQQLGLTLDQLLETQGFDELRFRADARQHAQRAITADLVLEAVARGEDLQVTSEELGAEIAQLAAALGREPKDVAMSLDRSGQVVALAGDIIRSKALDLLVEHANIRPEGSLEAGPASLKEDPGSSDASEGPSEQEPSTQEQGAS